MPAIIQDNIDSNGTDEHHSQTLLAESSCNPDQNIRALNTIISRTTTEAYKNTKPDISRNYSKNGIYYSDSEGMSHLQLILPVFEC